MTGQTVSDSQYEDESFVKVCDVDDMFVTYVLELVRTKIKQVL